jgi:membrane associated rhomboid family serine protease
MSSVSSVTSDSFDYDVENALEELEDIPLDDEVDENDNNSNTSSSSKITTDDDCRKVVMKSPMSITSHATDDSYSDDGDLQVIKVVKDEEDSAQSLSVVTQSISEEYADSCPSLYNWLTSPCQSLQALTAWQDYVSARLHRKLESQSYWLVFAGINKHRRGTYSDLIWTKANRNNRRDGRQTTSIEQAQKIPNSNLSWPFFCVFLFIIELLCFIPSRARVDYSASSITDLFTGPDKQTLLDMGALSTFRIIDNGEWYRLWTSILVQASLLQFIVGMALLLLTAVNVERIYGTVRTTIVFGAAAVGGNLVAATLDPTNLGTGISGGLFGLLGMYVADTIVNWDMIVWTAAIDQYKPQWIVLRILAEIVIAILGGLTPLADNFINMGGLWFGMTIGLWLVPRLRYYIDVKRDDYEFIMRNCVIRAVVTGMTIVLVAVLFHLLSTHEYADGPVCPGCRFMSCLPIMRECDGCAHVEAVTRTQDSVRVIELTCPFGGSVWLNSSDTMETVKLDLPSMCRQYCAH